MVYTPAASYTGTDTFGYTATTAAGTSAPQTFTITLTPASTGGVATDTAAAGVAGYTAVRGQPAALAGTFTGGTAGTAFVIAWGDGTTTAAVDFATGTFAAAHA